jgi:hypothetical protein
MPTGSAGGGISFQLPPSRCGSMEHGIPGQASRWSATTAPRQPRIGADFRIVSDQRTLRLWRSPLQVRCPHGRYFAAAARATLVRGRHVGRGDGLRGAASVGALTAHGRPAVVFGALVGAGVVEGAMLGWGRATVLRRALPGLRRRQWVAATACAATSFDPHAGNSRGSLGGRSRCIPRFRNAAVAPAAAGRGRRAHRSRRWPLDGRDQLGDHWPFATQAAPESRSGTSPNTRPPRAAR